MSLTAQQPEVNLARVAIEALAGVLGGTQSLHTDSYDEALALPTEKAARLALRTQQVIAEETGVTNVADPLGGSWFVESLTDELEAQAEATFAELIARGDGSILEGVLHAIEDGWFQNEIAEAAYRFQRDLGRGDAIIVGVNAHTDGDDGQVPLLVIDPGIEAEQLRRLAHVKTSRDPDAAAQALDRLGEQASDSSINLLPALIEASRARCTVGEQMTVLRASFGTWVEPPLS